MAKGFTGETFITYSRPRPFTLPTQNIRRNVRFGPPFDDIVQRQFIEMSAVYIEECMLEIDIEYRIRDLTPPTWYAYISEDESDKVSFTPQRDGRTLRNFAMKFYPLYIRDLQEAIEGLMADTDRPDTLGGHFARVFANKQGVTGQAVWTNDTKLRDGIRVPAGGQGSSENFITINPLSNALGGSWPFTPEDIAGLIQKIGVTMDGKAQHKVSIDDPNFPQFLVGMPSGFGEGLVGRDPTLPQDGRDTPMRSVDRPTRDARVTENQLGQTITDIDQGYGYMGALALSLHQVRYQPPQIETFPTNITPIWYTSNLVGPLTPNLAWVLAQPIEQAPPILNNWGSWFFSGFVGVQGNQLKVEAKSNPQESEACQTECPFAVFFPPSTCQCTCQCTIESLAIWWSSDYLLVGGSVFMFNEVIPTQISPIRSRGKIINRNTRLIISGNNAGGRLRIGVKTAVIGLNDTPFVYVVDFGSDGITQNQGVGSNLPININFQEAIAAAVEKTFGESFYEVGGLDSLMALSIQCKTGSFATAECPAEFVPGGRICPNCLGSPCSFGTSTASVDYIFIGETELAGDPVSAYT